MRFGVVPPEEANGELAVTLETPVDPAALKVPPENVRLEPIVTGLKPPDPFP